jgi:pimeloyl-ACP methyl ester carboxylesterase
MGARSAPPVILVHGWPQHWWCWRLVAERLSSRFRCLMPDLRGHGWSEAPGSGYEKERLANDLAHLADTLRLERFAYIGHDWGGFVGFLLCLRQPERVRSFLALNILHPWPRVDPRVVLDLPRPFHAYLLSAPGLGEILLRRQPSILRAGLRAAAKRPGTFPADVLDAFVQPLREPARAKATVALYRTFVLREAAALLLGRYNSERLRVPSLLLFGTSDWAISTRLLRGFEAHADDMRLELVPRTGHFIVDERPELVADRALEHFAGSS